MTTVRTTVLLQQSLLDNADAIAKATNVSRDQLLEMALAQFVQHYQQHQTFTVDAINEAYADSPDNDDEQLLRGMRRIHRHILETND